jgi:hypothetical protein
MQQEAGAIDWYERSSAIAETCVVFQEWFSHEI